jgi:multidrug resistance efflux pump
MSVRVEVLVADEPAAWLVPLEALRLGPTGPVVRSGGREIPVRVRATGAFEAALEPSELSEGAPLEGGPFQVPAGPAGEVTGSGRRGGKLVAQGTLTSRVKDSLGPRVQGVWRYSITHLAPEGENVPAGAVVAGFDPKELTDRLALRRSELEAARKELEKTVLEGQQGVEELELQLAESKMKLEKAERKLDVPAELVGGLQQSVARYDADLARMEFELNRRRVDTARANLVARRANQEAKVARLDAEVEKVTASIEAMKLRAPRAGCVVYVVEDEEDGKPRVGGEVWQGRDVIEIADLSQMEVDARVPEPDAGRVSVGLRLDANPDKLFTGRVTELGRVFHPKSPETPSVVFDATVSIDNPDPELMRPGMAAEVTIFPGEAAREG